MIVWSKHEHHPMLYHEHNPCETRINSCPSFSTSLLHHTLVFETPKKPRDLDHDFVPKTSTTPSCLEHERKPITALVVCVRLCLLMLRIWRCKKRHCETCAMRMYKVKANYDSIMKEQIEATNFWRRKREAKKTWTWSPCFWDMGSDVCLLRLHIMECIEEVWK
jgi:hypothetical protein